MLEQSRFVLELKAHLMNQWEKFNLPGSPTTLAYRIRQAPLGRAIDRSRLVALWFHDNPEEPQVVTKWVPNKSLSSFLIQEHRHARSLYETRGHRFVPRPLDCPEILGVPVLIEEAVIGRSFAHQILSLPFGHKEGQSQIETAYSSMYKKAETILAQMQDPLTPLPKAEILSYLEPYIGKAETILGWEPEFKKKVKTILQNEIPEMVPGSGKTLLIGDFAPQNILEGEKGIFLIDLEFSLESPLAFLDPMVFAYTMSRFAIPDFSREEVSQAVLLLKEDLLTSEESTTRIAQDFLRRRGVASSHLRWYWLVFFIHETAFQQFLSETLPPQLKTFLHSMINSLVLKGTVPINDR